MVIVGGGGWTRRGVPPTSGVRRGQRPAGAAARSGARTSSTTATPNYVGDLGIGVNPALRERLREADLMLAVGARLGESDDRRLHAVRPAGAQAEAGARPCRRRASSAASTSRPCRSTRHGRTSPRRRSAMQAGRRRSAGRPVARGRARRLPQAHRARPAARARVDLARACIAWRTAPARRRDRHQRRRQLRRLAASLLPVSRLHAPSSRRPAAPWATACRRRWRRSSCSPSRIGRRLRRRRLLPDDGQEFATAVQHGAALIVSSSTTACTARSACTRSASIRAASSAPICAIPTSPPRPRLRRPWRDGRADRGFPAAFERAVASRKLAVLDLRMDPEIITTRTTAQRHPREGAGPQTAMTASA